VRHLHDFVRDVELTEAEWLAAIGFLTATGHMCSGKRQEFILLSDTLGVSMIVDLINHRAPGTATEPEAVRVGAAAEPEPGVGFGRTRVTFLPPTSKAPSRSRALWSRP